MDAQLCSFVIGGEYSSDNVVRHHELGVRAIASNRITKRKQTMRQLATPYGMLSAFFSPAKGIRDGKIG
ncbi:hypothetical protein [Dyella sp. S184]|uniref:hypothetical protein n=1 Tax=Dyella sp. S184 TaxID=1641862 RepID=UPI00131BFDA7|nr:hypothetical protein [Dyella sp. S184]